MFIKGRIHRSGIVGSPKTAIVFGHVTCNAGIGEPVHEHAMGQHTWEDEETVDG